MKIMKDSYNKLLKRREVDIIIETEKNPGFERATATIAEQFKVDPQVIALKAVRNNFGTRKFILKAYIYDSVDDKTRLEPRKKNKNKEKKA